MRSLVLSGISRGLGRELFNLLTDSDLPIEEYVLISRKKLVENRANVKTVCVSLGDVNCYSSLENEIKISNTTKQVIFVNNAGTVEPIKKAVDVSFGELNEAIRINCIGGLSVAQALVRQTKNLGAKLTIINISSGAANRPIAGWLAYCVSKASVVMAFDVLDIENEHIEVIHFDPGVMDTEMQRDIRNQSVDVMPDVEYFKKLQKNGDLRNPKEVAIQLVDLIRNKF